MKILIAEDDPMIQWVHQSMMTQWGYDYDLADNGYAALELARSNAGCYDLALMDVEMPCLPDKLLQDIHLLAVKQYRLRQLPEGGCHLSEERPVDKRHAEELRELAKKDLRKVLFFDHPGSTVVVHKNLLNKVSHDFNVKKQLLTTFVNRNEDKPTLCYLYRDSNYLMPQTFITEEEYDELIAAENSELGQYAKPALKGEED